MATPDQIRRRGRWSLVLGTVLAALMFAAIAYADNLQSDLNTTTGGLQKTVNLGTLPANTAKSQDVFLFVDEQPSGGNDPTYPFNVAGVKGGASTFPGAVAFSGVTISGPNTANGQTGQVTWTTPAAQASVQSYSIVETFDANTTINESPATITISFSIAAAPADSTPPVITPNVSGTLGNNGWYTSNVTVTWTVTDPDSAISSSSGCGSTTISSDTSGTTLTCTATSGGGTASQSVTIKRDATAPSAVTTLDDGPNGSNDWYTSAPAWTTDGDDSLSGLVNDPCQTGTYAGPEGTGLIVSGTCTDNAGNSASDDSDPFKYDATGPSAALAVTAGTLGSNGWYTSDVTVDTDGTDTVSSPVTCTGDQQQTTETAGQVFNGSCTNDAGLTTNAAPLTVKLDKTGPSAALQVTAGTLGGGGWYRTDVTVSTSGSDSVSDPTSCTANQFQTTSTDGETFNGACTNDAGLTTNATPLTVKLDKIPPTLTWAGGPADGASYYFGSVPAAPTCTSVDPLYSGPNGCTVSGYSAAVGAHTMTATALDLAGNSSSETRTYTVLAWTLNGFFQPVDMGAAVWNAVKGGSTVPLKFEIFAGTTELTDTAHVDSFSAKAVTCPNGDVTLDEIEVTVTGGTSLRYDATAGQFIYNWQTPKRPGSCYELTMKTDDGSALKANFKLK